MPITNCSTMGFYYTEEEKMSETVHCLAGRMNPYCRAEKRGCSRKIDRVSRIPIEPFGDTLEQEEKGCIKRIK